MRILLVHNRYRSGAPSGENRVVDQEGEALAALGHEVMRFGRSSDEIEQWSVAKKASLPARIVWSRETYRDLKAVLREQRPEVVHVHNTFPLLSAAVLYACRDARVPVVATIHNYRLACANGMFFRTWSCLPRLYSRPASPRRSCMVATGDHLRPPCPWRWPGACTGRHGDRWYRPTYSSQHHSVTCTGKSTSRPTAYSSGTTSFPAVAGHGWRGRPTGGLCGTDARGQGSAPADGRLGPLPRGSPMSRD